MASSLCVVLVGDAGAGKTSFAERFTHDRTPGHGVSTIGVEYHAVVAEGRNIRLWDTAGAERFRAITRTYYRTGDAVWLCFDGSDLQSFDRLSFWVRELRDVVARKTPLLLVALKGDLPTGPTDGAVEAFAKLHAFQGWERLNARNQTRAALHARLLPRLAAIEPRQRGPRLAGNGSSALDCCVVQ